MATLGNPGRNTIVWFNRSFYTINGITRQCHYSDIDCFLSYISSLDTGTGYETPTYMTNTLGKTLVPINYLREFEISRRSTDILFRDGNSYVHTVKLKDTTYFFGKGVIFNCERQPLLLTSLVVDTIDTPTITQIKIYVNPAILLHPQDTLNKYILTQILPFYMNTTVNVTDRLVNNTNLNTKPMKPNIEISDKIFAFFLKPEAPKEDLALVENENLNNIIKRNIDLFKI